MTDLIDLNSLVADAVALGGGDLCVAGHDWKSIGGRGCPKGEHNPSSQAVYRCARCGEYDYGEKGGPGWLDCQNCRCSEEDPDDEPTPEPELML